MSHCYEYEYVKMNGEDFFTIVLLPEAEGRFPVVVCRTPYVKGTVNMEEEEILNAYYNQNKTWLERGYAIVFQHCRGQGKSTGAHVPYVNEREDGLALREWIRSQPFYNGELYLLGGSYTASLHYATAPFEADIKGAVFESQDSERYRLWYRNGQMRKGHANWHFGLYKDKCDLNKCFHMKSFSELPLSGLSERVLGDRAEDFEQMLAAYSQNHEFWNTRFGGNDARDAVTDANIPILMTTGFSDFYLGGVFRMWEKMSARTKEKSALLVSPYNHGDGYHKDFGVAFPNGRRREAFGNDYSIAWFDHIRKGSPLPFEKGKVAYYRTFENRWDSDFYGKETETRRISLGDEAVSFVYDPMNPPAFREEGVIAESFEGRGDVISVDTEPFETDTFVKGRIRMKLTVASNCPDTSFYARICVKKEEFSYVLCHDITSLCYQLEDYRAGDTVTLDFCFDEQAFLIKAGECLRIDLASTDDNVYVCHTNKKGEYYLQTEAVSAENKVFLKQSCLLLPVECER